MSILDLKIYKNMLLIKKLEESIAKNYDAGKFFKKEYLHDVPGDWFTGPF